MYMCICRENCFLKEISYLKCCIVCNIHYLLLHYLYNICIEQLTFYILEILLKLMSLIFIFVLC